MSILWDLHESQFHFDSGKHQECTTRCIAQTYKGKCCCILMLSAGDPFEGIEEEGTESIPDQDGCCQAFVSEADAWKMAKGLGTLALTIFCAVTVVGIVEEVDTLWISSLSVVLLLLSVALVTSVLACRRTPHRDLPRTLESSTV